MYLVLFVCTGNTCRSSMAEALLKFYIAGEPDIAHKFKIISAGTHAATGNPANIQAVRALDEMGIDISAHRAQKLTRELIEKADLILTMESAQEIYVSAIMPQAKNKTHTLMQYAGRKVKDIADPYGQSEETYRDCATQIKMVVVDIIPRLRTRDFHKKDKNL